MTGSIFTTGKLIQISMWRMKILFCIYLDATQDGTILFDQSEVSSVFTCCFDIHSVHLNPQYRSFLSKSAKWCHNNRLQQIQKANSDGPLAPVKGSSAWTMLLATHSFNICSGRLTRCNAVNLAFFLNDFPHIWRSTVIDFNPKVRLIYTFSFFHFAFSQVCFCSHSSPFVSFLFWLKHKSFSCVKLALWFIALLK